MPAEHADLTPRIWAIGALCLAVSEALQQRFNPVAVRGEISGFTRAASGHCYFTLKDAQGQMRCALFRRAAQTLLEMPQDGEQVEVFGRLGVYEPRGELQIIVEGLRRAGRGALYEQFLQRKARLQALGWFDAQRKRSIPAYPKGIGVVTSLSAAALHDVMTALARRVPHLPVVVAPAPVQGEGAPAALVAALTEVGSRADVSVILLVRGGGSLEDLWAFNDEALAQAIVASPKPVICGVGHETDFTIADFCADLRAPTPTAAAELCAPTRDEQLAQLAALGAQLGLSMARQIERQAQRLDELQEGLTRPARGETAAQMRLLRLQQRLQWSVQRQMQGEQRRCEAVQQRWVRSRENRLQQANTQLDQTRLRLDSLDPRFVLERGYAWLEDAQGRAVSSTRQLQPHQTVQASLADGVVDLTVNAIRPRGIS